MERRAWWSAALLSWLLLCLPLLLVEVPPLADYPNHLARMQVLATIGDRPAFASGYVVHWGIVPDLAIDGFMPWLVSVLPIHVAGRILVGGILLLDVLGVIACAAALHGRATWWSLAGALAAYNTTFLMGFLNFNLAVGLAMLAAGAWIAVRRHGHPAAAACLGIATCVLLFFAHLMGLCFYLALISSSEFPAFAAIVTNKTQPSARRVASAAARCWPVLVTCIPAPLLYAASSLRSAEGPTLWLGLPGKLMDCAAGFWTYDWRLDATVMVAVAGVLALSNLRLATLRLARGGLLAFAVVLILMVLLPQDLKGTGFVGTRPAVMAAFLLFIVPAPSLAPSLRLPAAIGLALLFLGKVAVVADYWSAYQTDVTNMRTVVRAIQPGDRVFQLDVGPEAISDYAERAPKGWQLAQGHTAAQYLGALIVIENGALWSPLFADPVQQPVSLQATLAASIASAKRGPHYEALALLRRSGAKPDRQSPYCGFDWVLLFGAWADPDLADLAPSWLKLTRSNRTAALYRVRQDSCEPTDTLEQPSAM